MFSYGDLPLHMAPVHLSCIRRVISVPSASQHEAYILHSFVSHPAPPSRSLSHSLSLSLHHAASFGLSGRVARPRRGASAMADQNCAWKLSRHCHPTRKNWTVCKACYDLADVDTQDTLKDVWNCAYRGCWKNCATNERFCNDHLMVPKCTASAASTTPAMGDANVIGLAERGAHKRVFEGVNSVKGPKRPTVLKPADLNLPRCVAEMSQSGLVELMAVASAEIARREKRQTYGQ